MKLKGKVIKGAFSFPSELNRALEMKTLKKSKYLYSPKRPSVSSFITTFATNRVDLDKVLPVTSVDR